MFITKRTFRSQLLIVVLSVLLPAMAVVAFLLHHRAEQQLRLEERAAEREAVAMARILDREITNRARQLVVLRDAFEAHGGHLDAAVPLRRSIADDGLEFVVVDADKVSGVGIDPKDREIGTVGRPDWARISPVFRRGDRWAVTIWMPWSGEYVLAMVLPVEHVARLAELSFGRSSSWRWGITDQKRNFVARSEEHDRFVGMPLPAELVEASRGPSGASRATSVDGTRIIRGYAEAPSVGWLIAVAAPESLVNQPMRQLWSIFGLGAIGALAAFLVGAYRVTTGLNRSVVALTEDVALLGSGKLPPARSLPVADLQVIHEGLHAAAVRREAQTREMGLVLRELEHRTKNMLAVVLSLADRTLKDAPDVHRAREMLLGRLRALANATDELSKSSWQGASVRSVVEQSTAPFSGQFTIEGPDLQLTAQATTNFALIVHELMTNAVKHGALSVAAGRVALRWGIDGDAFAFEWREANGPVVVEPVKTGFGTRLFRAACSGSDQPSLEYLPEGLRFRARFPLNTISGATN